MATNDFQAFAVGSGANVLTQAQYLALAALGPGFSSGTAVSQQLNKVWRQGTFGVAAIAQAMADILNSNILDDGTVANFEKQFVQMLGLAGYGADTGAANAYAVTYAVPVLALTDGLRLRFKAANANTGASTFAPSGLTSKPIWSTQHAALTGGEIAAGSEVTVVFSSALNSGNGAWVLLDSSAGASALASGSYGVTPAQFNNSTLLATTGFVQTALGNYAGTVSATNNQTLTTAAAGKLVNAGSGVTALTLPTATSFPAGGSFIFSNTGAANCVLSRQGSDLIVPNSSTITSVSIAPGDSAIFISVGGTLWYVLGSGVLQYSSSFGATLAASGYQKLPSGLIMQWGTSTTSASSSTSVTFPIAFPTACYGVTLGASDSGTAVLATQQGITASSFSLSGWTTSGARAGFAMPWFAIGR